MTEGRGSTKLGALLLVALAVAVAWYVPVEHGEPPQDDAYISYIYARNFARGEGLVFNPGEPAVEGYTNFLWTVLIGWGFRLGIDPEAVAPRVDLAITLLTVVATFWFARRIGSSDWFAAVAALLFSTRPTLAVHAMGGLETPLFGLLVLLATGLRLRGGGGVGRQWAGSSLLALAALTRPEGVLLYGLFELHALWSALRDRTPIARFVRDALVRGLPFLFAVGCHVAWRRVTYGDWVPNTFHAKVSPGLVTWTDGWRYVSQGIVFFGPLFIALPYLVRFGRADEPELLRDRGLCLWITTTFTLYVLYVGGDYIPSYRFLWPVMPIWSAMAAASTTRLCGTSRARTIVGTAIFLGLIALHTTHEYRKGHRWEGLELRHRQLVQSGKLLDRILPEDTWIAVTAAGRIPYFADRKTLDMMGLSDAHIGRRATMKQASELAGHLKGDGKYVLDRRPDLILFLKLMVGTVPLASNPEWERVAAAGTFGVSERELVADPRFFEEYRAVSLPLGDGQSWLNVFARDGAFGGSLPPGAIVGSREE